MAEEKNMNMQENNQNNAEEQQNTTPGGNQLEVTKKNPIKKVFGKVKDVGVSAGKKVWDNRGKIALIGGAVIGGIAMTALKKGKKAEEDPDYDPDDACEDEETEDVPDEESEETEE